MGLTQNLGRLSPSIFTDSSLNVGIGAAPSGTYKFEVTGTAKVSSTLLLGGALTGTNASFVGTGDFSSGALTLTLGADNGLTTRTNATQKIAKIVSYNYTNANNPVGMMVANNDGTDNALWIGGGSGAVTAATSLTFFTAANNNTATGTARLTIASTGAATFTNTETTFNYNPQSASLLSGYNYLNFGGGSIMYRNATDLYIGSNAKYGSAGTTVAMYTSVNGMGMLTMDGGTLNYQATDTSVNANSTYGMPIRFTIKNAGNTLITAGNGTYPSSTSTSYGLQIFDPTTMAINVGGSVIFQGYKTSTTNVGNLAGIAGKKENGTAGDESGFLGFLTSNSSGTLAERMRITSGGYLKATSTGTYNDLNASNFEFVNGTASANSFFVGNTNTSYSGATLVRINGSRTTINATYNLIGATNGNSTGEFLVRDSGNCQNTNNSYTGTSDIKLKQDIIDANSQWDDIKQMRIRKFRFKKQVEQDENAPYLLGVIAQELELVSPNLVDEALDFDGTGEEVTSTTKSVKYSIIYMKAVKALQEAMGRIESLESRLDKAGL